MGSSFTATDEILDLPPGIPCYIDEAMFDRSLRSARSRSIGGVMVSTCLVNVEQRAEVSVLVNLRETFSCQH